MITADPDLQAFLLQAYQYVVGHFDIDGFRIDTLRYLQDNPPQLFGNSVRDFALSLGNKNSYTFGEMLDGTSEQGIALFIGRNTTTGDDNDSLVCVDAALDYPLYNVPTPTVKGFSAPSALVNMYQLRKLVKQLVLSSHGEASRYFVAFLDNHDMKARIRFEQPGNPDEFDDQVTMGMACLFCSPGVSCLHDSTDQGLHGAGSDPAVREALWGIAPTFPRIGFPVSRAVPPPIRRGIAV
jgi:glycosidase